MSSVNLQSYSSLVVNGDWGPALQAALNTGNNVFVPASNYLLKTGVTVSVPGQQIYGENATESIFLVGNASNAYTGSGNGVIVFALGSSESQAGVADIGLTFYQPSNATRSTIISYPWALYADSVSRLKFGGVIRITNAWNGICLSATNLNNGNPGGFEAGSLQISAYSQGMFFDGAADSVQIDELKLWPYGMATNPSQLAAYGDGIAVGLTVGRCDGLNINSLKTFQQRIRFLTGADGTSAIGTIVSLHLDGTFGRLEFSSGQIAVGEWYATTAGATDYLISQSGGYLNMGPAIYLSSVAQPGSDMIRVSGGTFGFQAGASNISDLGNGASALSQTGGNVMWFGGYVTAGTNQARTKPFFNCTGGRLTLKSARFPDLGSGSGAAIAITNDENHDIEANALLGWLVQLPSTIGNGHYQVDQVYTTIPSVSFNTPGNSSFTYNTQTTTYRLNGDMLSFELNLVFSTNAYTGVAGAFVISSGIPYNAVVPTAVSLAQLGSVTLVNGAYYAAEVQTNGAVLIRKSISGAPLDNASSTEIPPSRSNITLRISGSYRV